MEATKTVLENIQKNYDLLFLAEKKVADCILDNPQKSIMMNVSELAAASEVSDATVIRMCKHIGYQGYYQMRLVLSHDMGRKDEQPDVESPIDSVKRLFERFAHNISSIANNIEMEDLAGCVKILKESEMVYVVGAGNTTSVALDLGFRLERLGIRTSYATIPEHFLNHVSLGTEKDAIVIVSKSGTSIQTTQALELAKKNHMRIIAITASDHSPLTKSADYVLLTGSGQNLFDDSEPDDHLPEMAMCNALLYFISHGASVYRNQKNAHSDEIEMLLSEYKL